MPTRSVSATRVVAAPASAIFDVLADPRRHSELDGSGTVLGVREGPERLSLGATFTMRMKMGARYETRNVVVAFEEDRAIAWHHVARFVWRYDLDEVEGGTRVTESFTYDKPWALAIIVWRVPQKNRRSMEASLERLERIVTSSR
jgi:hypothetical protein